MNMFTYLIVAVNACIYGQPHSQATPRLYLAREMKPAQNEATTNGS